MLAKPSSLQVAKAQRRAGMVAAAPVQQQRPARSACVQVRAADAGANPIRQALTVAVSGIYKIAGTVAAPESGLSPMWQALKKLDGAGVKAAAAAGADLNERDAAGDTPLLYIARQGHYKYPPADIPAALIKSGADMEARDKNGLSPLQVSLLAGWQNISELLIQNGASTANVGAIKGRITCPDCKRVVAKYNL